MKKEHLEVLLEDIRGKFELVLEGHESLREEIRQTRRELHEQTEQMKFLLKTVNQKVDAVADDLSGHRRDTEAHRKGWRVKEEE